MVASSENCCKAYLYAERVRTTTLTHLVWLWDTALTYVGLCTYMKICPFLKKEVKYFIITC